MPVVIPSNKAGFRHKETPFGTLVVPKHSKWSWTVDERRFRSAIVHDGQIVSSGLVKFGGLEDPGFLGDVERLKAELAETGRVRLVEKLDGVLAIRSVIDGRVVWRTRGTHDGGVHLRSIHRLVPASLEDPTLLPDASILFELTDPEWRIVLDYNRPSLTLIGAINHRDSRHWTWDECVALAERIDVEQPESDWWTGSWRELVRDISHRVGTEGVVAQSIDGQTLVKIKTESYCSLHRIRFVHQGALLVELWERSGWNDVGEAHRWLADHGVNVMHVPDLAARVEALCATRAEAEAAIGELDSQLLVEQMRGKGASRRLLERLGDERRPIVELLADGREAAATDKLRRELVEGLLIRWDAEDDLVDEPV